MRIIYSLVVDLYVLFIRISSLFSDKARKWVRGRKGWEEQAKLVHNGNYRLAWFHCASLGEFEQGRPVMSEFRKKFPDWKILVTFFSPSGYEVRKNFAGADFVMYLPADTLKNSTRFVKYVNPDIVFFVKYEFWFNYINELNKFKIPIIYFSSIFRPGQHFFSWYGWWFREQLSKITWFFVQNTVSADLLNSVDINNLDVCGDTRFDRVIEATMQAKEFPVIENFAKGRRILLAGSSWPADEKLLQELLPLLPDDVCMVIAPHNVDEEHVNGLMSRFADNAVKLSEFSEVNNPDCKVLVVDGMGFLIHLYRYAYIAYIGGGFGKSIHNILEAATFGKPVIFGPNYEKFQEAHDLIAAGGAFSIGNIDELEEIVKKLLNDSEFYAGCSAECSDYVAENRGATRIIILKTEEILRMELDY